MFTNVLPQVNSNIHSGAESADQDVKSPAPLVAVCTGENHFPVK